MKYSINGHGILNFCMLCFYVWLLGLEMEKKNNLNDVENKIFIYLMNDEGLKWMSEMKWKFKEVWLVFWKDLEEKINWNEFLR